MDQIVPEACIVGMRTPPETLGLDPARLGEAVSFAQAHETVLSRDLERELALGEFEPPPWNERLGPIRPRGGPNGLILRHGQVAAEWGGVDRVDPTFSVAKSYLAVLVGIAVKDGLIRDVHDPVRDSGLDDGFDSAQNREITWHQLLQQTSEWEGTLFDKPDLVDRNRQVGTGADNSAKGQYRELGSPGSFWEYNDVRVNRLALSLMLLFRRPLPEVLKERVMDPIGASNTWEWHGYRNSFVEVDGKRLQSVPGGSHWGGGIWISSHDHARFGLLVLGRGRWGDLEILPEGWFGRMFEPCPVKPGYGYLWWLNTGRGFLAEAPESSVFASGVGGNVIWLEPEANLLAVVRWIDRGSLGGFVERVMVILGNAA